MDHFTLTADVGPAADRLDEVGSRATQLRPIFDDLVGALVRGEQSLFRQNHWLPNQPETIARKILRGQDPRPMRATGQLEHMLTSRNAAGQIADGGGSTLTFGARHIGAHVAKYSKNPRRRRDVLDGVKRPRTSREIKDIILRHIVGDA